MSKRKPRVYPIPGFPHYFVSRTGQVFSSKQGRLIERKQVWTGPGKSKYLCVSMRNDGKYVLKKVHAIVLEAFVGSRPPGMEACHNDGNRANNAISNLRWDTKAGNEADKVRHGTLNLGVKNGNATITPEIANEIASLRANGMAQARIASSLGVTRSVVYAVCNGSTWGYVTGITRRYPKTDRSRPPSSLSPALRTWLRRP